MNKILVTVFIMIALYGCSSGGNQAKRIPVAKAGNVTLYYDEIPDQVKDDLSPADSAATIQNYINKWARSELMFRKPKQICLPV